ncbi:MAG: ABC transporter ATP-binding protein [Nitrospinaceae bacterium]|nr:ABC transporter ATP-binding protein [Nitrospinaceae bacterium]
MPDLKIENLTKTFGDTVAVNNLSLTFKEGESVVLLGPSGCGKTTLLKLIAGFLNPDAGSITIGDKELSNQYEVLPPDQRQMSMVFQSYAIWPHKTVFQNVAYGLEVRKINKTEIKRRVMEALSLVQLDGLDARYSTELSGGQQQRVALARAIVVEPSLLLLDEPLSNLDANLREEMRGELVDLHERLGITFVFVTHDQAEAMVLGDRIVLMELGSMIQEGSPEGLYQTPRNRFAASFIGTSNIFSGMPEGDASSGAIQLKTEFGPITVARQVEKNGTGSEEGYFCIRPEWVKFHHEAPATDTNIFRVKIMKRQYYGKYIQYTVELSGKEVFVESESDVGAPIGSEVILEFPPDRCVCLEND